MTNWTGLLLTNPEPTLLEAIEFAERDLSVFDPSNTTTVEPRPWPEAAKPVKRRVRIVQDSHPTDPRNDMDFMCEINGDFGWRNVGRQDHYVNIISQTNAYDAACQMLSAATPDGVFDPPDLYDEKVMNQWLELLADTELKTLEFSTQSYRYVAHTTPEMCAKLGVDWANAEKAMEGECDMFQMWAEGDVYGYVIEEWKPSCDCADCDAGDWEDVDSCWGFYGSDPFENGMSDHVPDDLHDELRRAEPEYR